MDIIITLYSHPTVTMLIQLLLALILGLFIGAEREQKGKSAGFRTYAFVSLGASLFTIISVNGFTEFAGAGYDPSRIAGQVVVGIGFLGAGIIFLKEHKVQGLTTAASLWVMSAIGVAVGVKLYAVAIFTAILTFLVLRFLRKIEHDVFSSDQDFYKDLDQGEGGI